MGVFVAGKERPATAWTWSTLTVSFRQNSHSAAVDHRRSRQAFGLSSSLAMLSNVAGGFGGRGPFRLASAFGLALVNCLFDLVVRVTALHLSDPLLLHTPQVVQKLGSLTRDLRRPARLGRQITLSFDFRVLQRGRPCGELS